jgi:nitrate reductase gamma subunit
MKFGIEQLHLVSLTFMIVVYGTRIVWILRFRLMRDRARPRGAGWVGAAAAMTTMLRPWSMESTRKGWLQWIEFVIFHVGVAVMIGMSFVISFSPQWLTPPVVTLIIVSQALALVAGVVRLIKRIRDPLLRAISSPDDYFSLAITDVLFACCILATLHVPLGYEAYFVLVAAIIAYVPFSKISHYLYYPIARYFYGSYLGRRGIVR